MLVLSRQRDETIMIGNDIELTVVDIRGDKVRLGIKAPSHIAVHRKEVFEAIRLENEEAAHLAKNELPDITTTVPGVGKQKTSIPAAGRVNLQNSTRRKESA